MLTSAAGAYSEGYSPANAIRSARGLLVPRSVTQVVTVDLANLPQFQRLLRFAEETHKHARLVADDELQANCAELALDLAALTSERSGE